MEAFAKMNQLMDLGWKVTNESCQTCNGFLMRNLQTKANYCLKCKSTTTQDDNKYFDSPKVEPRIGTSPAAKVKEEVAEQDSGNEDGYYEELYRNYYTKQTPEQLQKQRKSDQVSKKMGQYLLKGWAMLETSCPDCLVPLMKPKEGPQICVGCDKKFILNAENNTLAQVRPAAQEPKLKPSQSKPLSNNTSSAPAKIIILPKAPPTLLQKLQKQPEVPAVLIANPPQPSVAACQVRQQKQSGDLASKSKQILEDILTFYQQRVRSAISSNDESEISRTLDKMDKLLSLVSKASAL